jgi:hypothetical protein
MSVSVHIVSGPIENSLPPAPSPVAGASLTFRGLVRPTEDGKHLSGLRALKPTDRWLRTRYANYAMPLCGSTPCSPSTLRTAKVSYPPARRV